MCICCLSTTQRSWAILGQISAARSESWYGKLELCFISFWFYYYRLWWSSWHVMLVLFLLYIFLVWICSWRDWFQVKGTDARCVLYIIRLTSKVCSHIVGVHLSSNQVTYYFTMDAVLCNSFYHICVLKFSSNLQCVLVYDAIM